MDISTKIDKKNQIIVVRAACLLDQNIQKNTLYTIALHIKERNIDLTESSFRDSEPMAGALELASFMTSLGIPGQTKLAFIFSEAEEHRKGRIEQSARKIDYHF